MTLTQDTQIRLLSDPLMYYTAMLNDIRQAEKYVYIEIYRFRNDPMGVRFRDTLIAKQKQGVRVKLLIDSWGASSSHHFFQELVDAGGELTFFKKIRFNWDGFTKSHRRDHRKIIAIDDQITWIGSANITSYSLNWRESMFRIKSEPLTRKFKTIILENLRIHNKYFYDKYAYTRVIKSAGFEIIRDVPALAFQPVKKKFLDLITNASREASRYGAVTATQVNSNQLIEQRVLKSIPDYVKSDIDVNVSFSNIYDIRAGDVEVEISYTIRALTPVAGIFFGSQDIEISSRSIMKVE